MSTAPRYAIYFVPPAESAVYRFGAALLGYDAFTNRDLDHPAPVLEAFADWHDVTSEPRKYGFHATFKAPFLLKPDIAESDLADTFDRFARTPRAIPVITPVVQRIGGFIAIVPATPSAELAQLADDCVTAFDSQRAPLAAAERERRMRSPLTKRQIAHLDRWGYPYVYEDFRFHMTLTGNLTIPKSRLVLPIVQSEFERWLLTSITIEHIALLRQEHNNVRFVVIRHAALARI